MPQVLSRIAVPAWLGWTVVWSLSGLTWAQAPMRDGFEGVKPSWTVLGGDAPCRLVAHLRSTEEAHSGDWCEFFALRAGNGTTYFVSRPLEKLPVIDELKVSLWIRSDRPGLHLSLRIVLPRSKDPGTGKPVTTTVMGSGYTEVGRWQRLSAEGLPELLSRQARYLRVQLRTEIDVREAYVDQVLVNCYGGIGETNVWLDDLEVEGWIPLVSPRSGTIQTVSNATEFSPAAVSHASSAAPSAASRRPRFEQSGSILLIDGHPFFPRVVEHQGEPLRFLAGLGFNAVRCFQLPSTELLREAEENGLWLIAPPPDPKSWPAVSTSVVPPADPMWNRILAWDLGSRLYRRDFEETKHRAERLRQLDGPAGRWIICGPEEDLRGFSRHVDLLAVERSVLGTSLELTAFETWLRLRPHFAKPGIPLLTTVQTQIPRRVQEQIEALGGTRRADPAATPEQIRLMTYMALSAGARGVLFQSNSRLDLDDEGARERAMSLELLNLELDLVEPWVTTGEFETTVTAGDPQVTAAVIRSDRARLVLPVWTGPGAQYVPGQSAANNLSLRVPGVPEDFSGYEITPAGIRVLRPRRLAGGMNVTLEEFGLTSIILLSRHPKAVAELSARLAALRQRAAGLQLGLFQYKLRQTESSAVRWAGTLETAAGGASAGSAEAARRWLDAAKGELAACDRLMTAGDYEQAYLHAQRGMRPLRLLERARWEQLAQSVGSPVSIPTAVSSATLEGHEAVSARFAAAGPARNQLPQGTFENLPQLLSNGWRRYEHPQNGIRSRAELSPAGPHGGSYSLRLSAQVEQGDAQNVLIESPPVWITTPALEAEAGQIFRIHGWARVARPIAGSVDGLMIVESLGGEDLSERIDNTFGWREFTLYRAAIESGPFTVSFVLSGLGEAWIDDVTVEPYSGVVSQSANQALRRLPPVR